MALIQLIKDSRAALEKIEKVIGPHKVWREDPIVVADLYDGTPVEDLELSVRIENCFREEGIKTVGDLIGKTDRDLLRITNFGRVSLAEVKEALRFHREGQEALRSYQERQLES